MDRVGGFTAFRDLLQYAEEVDENAVDDVVIVMLAEVDAAKIARMKAEGKASAARMERR